jgi:transposase-like protein
MVLRHSKRFILVMMEAQPMKMNVQPPMHPDMVACPNPSCSEPDRIGVHSRQERRYICHACKKTFAETLGTPLYGLHYPSWVVGIIVTLLAYGCPIQAIVAAFGIDERTVTTWQQKAGRHAKRVQETIVNQGTVDIGQVQADELYVKTQGGKVWVATAMSVASRLFLWGDISPHRDTALIQQVITQVRAAVQEGKPILIAVDGFASYVTTVLQVFRDPRRTGRRGRPRRVVWDNLHIVQVVKHRAKRRVTEGPRRVVHGSAQAIQQIIASTQGGTGMINTAYGERLNATLRGWMPALVRRSRTPARVVAHLEASLFWTGGVYNFCRVHTSLGVSPAMAAGLTDHVWSIEALLLHRCT